MRQGVTLALAAVCCAAVSGSGPAPHVLLSDDFRGLTPGMLSPDVVGAHAEYHYLAATAPRGNWVVSTFLGDASQRAWRLVEVDGKRSIAQTYVAPTDLVWDPWELWIYTQSDTPKPGRLYKPRRNPLYNYSNYQATVSLPGWSEP